MRACLKHLGAGLAFLSALLFSAVASAQGTIQQNGAVTAFHSPYWQSNGVVGDGGLLGNPYLNSIPLFSGVNCPLSISSQSSPGPTSSPYALFSVCQSATATRLTIAGINGQATPTVYFNIGGVDYPFPFGGAGAGVTSFNTRTGIVTLNSSDVTTALGFTPLRSSNIVAGSGITVTPSGSNVTIAATGSGSGTVTNVAVNASLTGGPCTTTCTLGRAALTGDITASAGSNATTLATVNTNTGTWGSSTSIPAFTVNGKGLITAAATTTLTAALDAAFSSSQGAILYRNVSAWTALPPGTSGNVLQTQGAGANPIWAALAGGGGSALSNIPALRALTFSATANVNTVAGYAAAGDGGGGVFVYVASDTSSSDNNCTIFVDASSRRWYRLYDGPLNVKFCGAKGDGSTNDTAAIQHALSAALDVYLPTGTFIVTGNSLDMGTTNGRHFHGAGANATVIQAAGGTGPILKVNATIIYLIIDDLYLNRSGTAVSGDDGFVSGPILGGPNFYNLVSAGNWNGYNFGPTDSGWFSNSYAASNLNDGVRMQNAGSGAGPGQLQMVLTNIFSTTNGLNGFHVISVGSFASQITMGTWNNLATFGNNAHGAYFQGSSGTPIQDVRIKGGFFGQDGDDEIRLDTYNNSGHVVEPDYTELAGTSNTGPTMSVPPSNIGSGIYISANNQVTEIRCGICNANSYDGITTGGSDTVIAASTLTNNGVGGTTSRQNGINIIAGASGVSISGVKASNTNANTSQKWGVSSVIDEVAIAGSDLRGNTTSYYAFPSMPTNLQVAAVLPAAANTGASGGPFLPLSGGTMSGNIVMAGNSVTGAATLSGGAVTATGTIQGLDIYATRSMGLAAAPDGVSGHFSGNTAIAFSGGLNVNITGALAVTGESKGFSVFATNSIGVGSSPPVTAGLIAADQITLGSPSGGALGSGTANAATSLNLNGTPYTNP